MKECIEDLAQAIILQAILDYREALKTLENDRKRKRKQKARQRERRKKQKGTPDTPLQKKIDGKERKDTETHTCRAKRIRRARRMKRDVEEFFRSNWYRMISELDPAEILEAVKRGDADIEGIIARIENSDNSSEGDEGN